MANDTNEERLTAGPTVTVVKVAGEETGGKRSVVEMHLEAGWSGPPLHAHETVEHTWYIVDGAVTLTVGDDVRTYGKGDALTVPAGTPHGFSTATTDGAVVLEVDTPALDGYFRDLAEAFPAGGPPDPAVIAEIMGRHDTRPILAEGAPSPT